MVCGAKLCFIRHIFSESILSVVGKVIQLLVQIMHSIIWHGISVSGVTYVRFH